MTAGPLVITIREDRQPANMPGIWTISIRNDSAEPRRGITVRNTVDYAHVGQLVGSTNNTVPLTSYDQVVDSVSPASACHIESGGDQVLVVSCGLGDLDPGEKVSVLITFAGDENLTGAAASSILIEAAG